MRTILSTPSSSQGASFLKMEQRPAFALKATRPGVFKRAVPGDAAAGGFHADRRKGKAFGCSAQKTFSSFRFFQPLIQVHRPAHVVGHVQGGIQLVALALGHEAEADGSKIAIDIDKVSSFP